MMLVFDTSVIISIEKNDRKIIKRISELSKIYTGAPQTTFIAYYEFLLGIKNRSPKNQVKSIEFLNNFNCLCATKETSKILSDLKHKYNNKGISINLADLIIASQTKENNMALITRNKIFEKIEEISKIIV